MTVEHPQAVVGSRDEELRATRALCSRAPARLRSRRRRPADAPAVGPWGVNIHIPSEDDGVGRLSAPECC